MYKQIRDYFLVISQKACMDKLQRLVAKPAMALCPYFIHRYNLSWKTQRKEVYSLAWLRKLRNEYNPFINNAQLWRMPNAEFCLSLQKKKLGTSVSTFIFHVLCRILSCQKEQTSQQQPVIQCNMLSFYLGPSASNMINSALMCCKEVLECSAQNCKCFK